MKHSHDPGQREAAINGSPFGIKPLSSALGAEITGLDVSRPIDNATFQALQRAWFDNLVLLFREQELSDRRLVDFTARFGELEMAPLFQGRRYVEAHPEVMIISNVRSDGQEIGSLGNAEAIWHSDLNFTVAPPAGSFLYAIEVPPAGGDTGFANMYAAYETLPPSLKAAVQNRKIRHCAGYNSAGEARESINPDVLHPIVRAHPETNRAALYLGRRARASIEGLPHEESERLLDELWRHSTQSAFTWHHQWRAGDLLMWDNRCALHRRDSFDDKQKRVMHRTQARGSQPF